MQSKFWRKWVSNQDEWDKFWLTVATLVSVRSKDPSSKVGAVIVDNDKRFVSMGYNGFPRGTNDDPELYQDRPEKLRRVIHAETNAILSGAFQWRFFGKLPASPKNGKTT